MRGMLALHPQYNSRFPLPFISVGHWLANKPDNVYLNVKAVNYFSAVFLQPSLLRPGTFGDLSWLQSSRAGAVRPN